jgi:hypothetical protein
MSLTTDKNDPRLGRGVDEKPTPQNEVYLVLSEEEIAKGYVRPVRTTYIHVGRKYDNPPIMLDKPEFFNGKEYIALIDIFSDGKKLGATYLTKQDIEQYNVNGYIGGCGFTTTMNRTIAETYAREPYFYSSTYCVSCQKHLPVSEFLWDGTNERVGS